MYNYGDHEINYQRRFPSWNTLMFLVFSSQNQNKKKYIIKLITSIFMYHLKHLVSLAGSLKIKCRYRNHCSDLFMEKLLTVCVF